MSTTEFVSVANMRRLMAVLDSHFSENLGIDLASLGVPMKQFLHRVMNNVKKDYGKTHNIHDMNKVAVKIAKDFLMQVAKSQYESQRFDKKLDLVAPIPPPPPNAGDANANAAVADPVVDKAETGEEMAARIKKFEEEREKLVLEPVGEVNPPFVKSRFPEPMDVSIGNPYLDYASAVESAIEKDGTPMRVLNPAAAYLVDQNKPGATGSGAANSAASTSNLAGAGFNGIIPRSEKKRIVDRYLMVNGFNRDFVLHKNRFEFQVNLNTNDSTFSDIRSIAATKLIIPGKSWRSGPSPTSRTLTTITGSGFGTST